MILHLSITKRGKAQGVSTVISQFEALEFIKTNHVIARLEEVTSRADYSGKNASPINLLSIIKRLKNAVKKSNFMYLVAMFFWAGRITLKNKKKLNEAKLVVCHDVFTLIFAYYLSTPNQKVCLYNHSDGDPYATLRSNHGGILTNPFLYLIELLYKSVKVYNIYSLSESASISIKGTFTNVVNYKVINNFISSEGKLEKIDEEFKIWMIGTICNRKNQLAFFQELSKSVTHMVPKITVVGVATREQIEDMLQYDFVDYQGVKNNLVDKIASGDVILSVSTNEGLPMSMIEGASKGALILSTDVGGCHQICKNNVNGYLYNKSFEPLAVYNDLRYIKENPEVREAMSHKSFNIYQESFSSRSAVRFWSNELLD